MSGHHIYYGETIPKGEAFHGTREEQRILLQAVLNAFGPCTCHPAEGDPMTGRVTAVHLCDGHSFLIERDTLCSRLDRLAFARARAEQWRKQEFGLRVYYRGFKDDKVVTSNEPGPGGEDFPW